MPRSVNASRLFETLICLARRAMPARSNSSSQNARAKKPRISSAGSSSISVTPSIVVRRKRMASVHQHAGNSCDKFSAPFTDGGKIARNFVFQVPGQDEDVVGLELEARLGPASWNAASRQQAVLLGGVAVGDESDAFPPNAAVVQQC